jgi:hypothetical protein
MFTESQIKVLLILLDEMGHPGWELAEHIEMKESNLSPILKKLETIGIISHESVRDSTRPISKSGTKKTKVVRPKTRSGRFHEFPYYLIKNLEALRTIIRELKGKKYPHIDAGFVLNIISRSKYLKVMIELYGEAVNKCTVEELRAFPFAQNGFYTNWIDGIFPIDSSEFKEKRLGDRRLDLEISPIMSKEMNVKYMILRSSRIEIWYDNYLKSISPDSGNNNM